MKTRATEGPWGLLKTSVSRGPSANFDRKLQLNLKLSKMLAILAQAFENLGHLGSSFEISAKICRRSTRNARFWKPQRAAQEGRPHENGRYGRPPWAFLGPSWGHFGAILGPFWAFLGPSGPSRGHLEPSWGHLGHLVAILGHLGATLGHLGAMLGHVWAIFGPCWGHLGPAWSHLGLPALHRSCTGTVAGFCRRQLDY